MGGSKMGASHLERITGKPEAQLPADHHGLHNAPVLATHRPPYEGPVPLHQHLHPALVGVPAAVQAQLWTERKAESPGGSRGELPYRTATRRNFPQARGSCLGHSQSQKHH